MVMYTLFVVLKYIFFHISMLPVLSNTPSLSHQEGAAYIKPVNTVEILKSQDDFQTATKQAEIPCTTETQNSLNSDNDSIIAEPKCEDYELYEAVGDLSESVLNQISTQPEESKISTDENVKDIFYLESLVVPYALKMPELGSISDCNGEGKQSQVSCLLSHRKIHVHCILRQMPLQYLN
jgi:hypothetical protein